MPPPSSPMLWPPVKHAHVARSLLTCARERLAVFWQSTREPRARLLSAIRETKGERFVEGEGKYADKG